MSQYDPFVGTTLVSKYLIRSLIKKGSFGKIYSAIEVGTETLVAIKSIKIIEGVNEHKIKRDSCIPLRIKHKNITRIVECINTPTHSYIVYPYDPQHMPLNKYKGSYKMKIARQLASVIEFMHDNKVIHNDIKPHNIIVSEDAEEVFVIDFDLSFVIDNEDFPCRARCGTPHFMSPEKWWEGGDIDYYKSDIYAFGVTLYYLFNGKSFPYNAASIENLEYMIANVEPQPSKTGLVDMDELIMKMISKDPDKRPSIKEINQSLESIQIQI